MDPFLRSEEPALPAGSTTLSRRAFQARLAAAAALWACGGARLGAEEAEGERRIWLDRARERWCWPTPNPAFAEGGSLETFVQATGPENPLTSGTFGCVRNNGHRFHEGLDLFPLRRDRRGEALDPVFACAAGRVVYLNPTVGHSGYGRYVVVEHEDLNPRVVSLYAHLREIAPGLGVGRRVGPGEVLGGMGRSAGGYSIPRERAHLHFELAFRVSDQFESYYAAQKNTEPNRHGLYNGQNLLGLDPLDFLTALHRGRVRSLHAYLRQLPVAFVLRFAHRTAPDFLVRYPELLTTAWPERPVAGWDIGFTGWGLPVQWTPRLERDETTLAVPGATTILAVDTVETGAYACRRLLRGAEGLEVPAEALINLLRLLFGLR